MLKISCTLKVNEFDDLTNTCCPEVDQQKKEKKKGKKEKGKKEKRVKKTRKNAWT